MPDLKINFYGTVSDVSSESNMALQGVQPGVQITEYKAGTTRSETAKQEIKISENDLVSLQLSNDIEWHYNAEDFEKLLLKKNASRGINNLLEVPSFFVSESNTRGLEEIVTTKALKVITGLAARHTAELLAEKMEAKLVTGLHQLDANFIFTPFDAGKADKVKPYLLFIHGTNSSTDGAFNGLKKNQAYEKLFKFYEGRVIAFEHKTLSESPLKNAIDLLNALPSEITVDIVCHSRGGLIADIIARCSNSGLPFDNAELRIISDNEEFAPLSNEATAANKAASGKSINVAKMVRVATPSAGTVLIDSRLDNVVNVFCNIINLIPGAAACMPLGLFLDFARAVVHERTSIDTFPGLAAQIPGSPLVRLLNNPNRVIESQLFVISGDVEKGSFFQGIMVMATNLYFGEAHDLVVNSNSMFRGTYRKTNVMERFEQDPSVNHFNYFKNKTSQDALLAALTEPSKIDANFQNLGITSKISISHSRGITGKKPLVYILPGITNSRLERIAEAGSSDKNKLLWIDFLGLATGILSELDVSKTGIKATTIQEEVYGDLINFLSPDFDVKPFPYDWRLDLAQAGNLLATDISNELNSESRTNKDVHFIAHSMGGLVLRSMISSNEKLWTDISKSKKTKVLMLGVPNEGSYSLIRILLGKDAIIKKLALLDFVHSKKDILEIFTNFTGLLQLLPKNQTGIFEEDSWKELFAANSQIGVTPQAEKLARSAEFFSQISNTLFDNEIFRYVAGQAENTPSGYTIDKGKITFSASPEGDGRVLWSTIPQAINNDNIYYVSADHGSIPQYEKAFDGFRDLLTKGKTENAALSRIKPLSRGSAERKEMPDSDFVTIPNAVDLAANLLGVVEAVKKTAPKHLISVSVMNGDLVHSSHPVVVGHFKGDGIVNAEQYLDRALNYRLSEYHFVNNYPGDIGSHLIILDDKKGKRGSMTCEGLVVGLGEFGALTEGKLLVTLTQAFLALAIRFNEKFEISPEAETDEVDFGISALTVGSDFAGLRLGTSVKTIFLAVLQANEKLDTMAKRDGARFTYQKINHVEIVEIYQHKSVQVGRAIGDLLKQDGFTNFRFAPPEIRIGSGSLTKIAEENLQDNWHRLEVTVIKDENASPVTTMKPSSNFLRIRFTAITDKAHADENRLLANRLILDTLVERMARQANWNKSFSQTLYELLIPNSFKGFGSSLHNMVLIIDKETARYPWELLQDPNGISDKPMVVNTGIVRQLKSSDQRENVIINVSDRALVIGNPNTEGKYPDLPSAKNEALSLQQLLLANGLETTTSIGEQDIEIVQKLLVRSYKIIHIASHGIVGSTEDEATGVILGKEIIFSAGDFDQIRIVPEFVFINCCSSDKYDPAVADKMMQKYKLAASVGTQLIQMGVKAAIVTGWEIDDAAAKTFSSVFYESMFAGYSFGDAVRKAREETYADHARTNTWGAYQCYGDPFYAFKNMNRVKKPDHRFVSPVEAIYALDNLINEMTSSSKRSDTETSRSKIEAIIEGLHVPWKRNGTIVERIATAYKTIGLFDEAIQYYEQLFNLENANYSVKSVEQYFNIKIRFAQEQLKKEKIKSADASKIYKTVIEGLKKLQGNTLERYCLIGGAYRRLFESNRADIKTVIESAKNYDLAYKHGLSTEGFLFSYPFFNWLHLAILLQGKGNGEEFLNIPANLPELEAKALEYAKQSGFSEPDFYKKTATTSCHIGKLLRATIVDDIAVQRDKMIETFSAAWRREGTQSSKISFLEYLDFIKELLKKSDTKQVSFQDEKLTGLDEVAGEINKIKIGW